MSGDFIKYRHKFVTPLAPSNEDMTGRVLPHQDYYSLIFWMYTHDYRFVSAVYTVYMGYNYRLELWAYMQYFKATNGNWYLAGEDVNFRAITVQGVLPDAGFPFEGSGVSYAQWSSINQTLKLYVGTSPRPFAGKVTGYFEFQEYADPTLGGDGTWHNHSASYTFQQSSSKKKAVGVSSNINCFSKLKKIA